MDSFQITAAWDVSQDDGVEATDNISFGGKVRPSLGTGHGPNSPLVQSDVFFQMKLGAINAVCNFGMRAVARAVWRIYPPSPTIELGCIPALALFPANTHASATPTVYP
jgi:hypothetical protein